VNLRSNFGRALKAARKLRNASQESLDVATSRTYVSSLERGLKSPTIDKVDSIATALEIHALTLLAYSYVIELAPELRAATLERVSNELQDLLHLQE